MGSSKFIRMLKDMNIISNRGLSIADADIIFKKIAGLNSMKTPYSLKNINERNVAKPVFSSFPKRNSISENPNEQSNLKPKMNFS
jgi:hypothetical protein